MMKKNIIITLAIWVIFNGCAVQKAPSGGPVDKTAPEIEVISPPIGSTQMNELQAIHLKFSENVNRSSFSKSLRIAPHLKFNRKFKWKSDKEVIIKLEDTLKQNTTYIITIGTELTDLHQVKLKKPVLIPFSTDTIIHQCKIRGKIFEIPRQTDITIAAFPVLPMPVDSPWFATASTLETTPDNRGEFVLNFLKPGTYRLLAYMDNNYNQKFDIESDSWAVFSKDVQLSHNADSVSNMFTRFLLPDTATPTLRKVTMTAKNQVRIEFNKGVLLSEKKLKIKGDEIYIPFLLQDAIKPVDTYTLWVKPDSLTDSLSLLYKSEYVRFNKTIPLQKASDSLKKPQMEFQIPDVVYFEDTLYFKSTSPVNPTLFMKALNLQKEKQSVKAHVFWNDFTRIGLIPQNGWELDKTYTLTLFLGKIRDFWGHPYPDSVISARLPVNSIDDLGGFSAELKDYPAAPSAFYQFKNLQSNRIFTRTSRITENNRVEISDLPGGEYTFWGWFESTGDNRWSPGRLMPFVPGEALFYATDTIKIRPRWIKDGFKIIN